jgi:hypothetical protein
MDFLAIVKRLRAECGITGTGPTTVVSQTGELGRLVDWTNDAWRDIQTAHQDWDWMRTSTSFATVQAQATYPLGSGAGTCGVTAATFGMWARNTGRSYVTSVGTNSEAMLDFLPYDAWRNTYQFGATRAAYSRPVEFSIAPDRSICLGPVPISGYTITLDYFTAPSDMAADADIPALPTQYHMAIVYRAMMFYGAYEAAPEVYQRGEVEFQKLMRRMTADRMPEMTWGPALA